MLLDGPLGDLERTPDQFVAPALGDQSEDLVLARAQERQAVERRGRGGRELRAAGRGEIVHVMTDDPAGLLVVEGWIVACDSGRGDVP